MKHNMKLRNEPYNSIYYNKKDIEMRLYDEKRKLIKVGDTITFTNIDTLKKFDVEVVNLYRYDNFKSLYNNFDKRRLGYKNEESANYLDMEKYYSKEEIKKYGVLGIEIRKM